MNSRENRRPAAAFAAACVLAAAALAACASAEDIETLLSDLQHADLEVRQDAGDTIDRLVREGDYGVFVRGLDSPNLLVRAESIKLLAGMSQPEARRALRDQLRVDRRMMLPYNPIRMKPASELKDSRILVARLIERGGGDPAALDVLLEGVDPGGEYEVAGGACYAVAVLRDPRGIAFLGEAAKSADAGVVRAAAQALGQFRQPEALAILGSLATHAVREVRSDVLSALADRGPEEKWELLKSMGSSDPASDLRAAAIQEIAVSARPEVVPYLIDRLADTDEGVRYAVQAALLTRTGQSLGPRPDRWRRWWERQQSPRAASR